LEKGEEAHDRLNSSSNCPTAAKTSSKAGGSSKNISSRIVHNPAAIQSIALAPEATVVSLCAEYRNSPNFA
jgi:hypothetical protein